MISWRLPCALALVLALPATVACGGDSRTFINPTDGEAGAAGEGNVSSGGNGTGGSSAGGSAAGGTGGSANGGSANGGSAGASGGSANGGSGGTGATGGSGGTGGSSTAECQDGALRCTGDQTREVCDAGVWVVETNCGGNTPVCINGVCSGMRLEGGLVSVGASPAADIQLVNHGFEPVMRLCGQVDDNTVCVQGGIRP